MVLWKKESPSVDACYIDLLPQDQLNRTAFALFKSAYGNIQKDDAVACAMRKQGNELFQARKWIEAIGMYNKSIRFAINGSENLGFGYANRAACFLHLQKYENCLVDIALARKSNYPERLMHKLDKREADCSEEMKKSTKLSEKLKIELGFSPNPKFPGMANILEVRSNDEFGKHVVAKRDIDVGKIVLLGDAFAFGNDFNCEIVCKTCAKHTTNFIPCPNCADVMFCNAQCMESNIIHKKFCCALYNRCPRDMLIVESILIAVSTFPNAECLMKFVENALATRDLDSPECDSMAQRNYRLFLKLFALQKDIETVRQQIFDVYESLLEIPFIGGFFHSQPEKRFLMHLIWQNLSILRTNCFGFSHRETAVEYITTIGLSSSFFNHSCAPNVLHFVHGNKMIGHTSRPIKKGEQLFISYYNRNENVPNAQERLQFQCKCSKCVPCWKLEDRIRIQSDPNYLFFESVKDSDFENHKKRPVLKSKLQYLFAKYGRLPWSPEFIALEIGLVKCCMEELTAWDY